MNVAVIIDAVEGSPQQKIGLPNGADELVDRPGQIAVREQIRDRARGSQLHFARPEKIQFTRLGHDTLANNLLSALITKGTRNVEVPAHSGPIHLARDAGSESAFPQIRQCGDSIACGDKRSKNPSRKALRIVSA